MPLKNGVKKLQRRFTKGVSYKDIDDKGEYLFDSLNMLLIQNKYTVRNGRSKFSTERTSANPQSLSFYKKTDGTRRVLQKCGTELKIDNGVGVFSNLLTGLSSSTKHDAVTMNNRHIIALGSDGLYGYDGTNMVTLGITAPSAPTTAIAAGGAMSAQKWEVAITYYASSLGAESNQGAASNQSTTAAGNLTIAVTAIPVSTHTLVDFKNVYIRNVTDAGLFYYVGQIANATTSLNITADPVSIQTPPDTNSVPLAGGAKYVAIFNSRLVYAGNSTYPNDVFFSEVDAPDAYDFTATTSTLTIQGDGDITGIATGFYTNSVLNQYLVIFKKRSTHVYYEDSAGSKVTIIDDSSGCVSHKTIQVKDGSIIYLSENGWRIITNGEYKKSLSDGAIDDIFKFSNYTYSVNKQNLDNAFGIFYSELSSYMCWVSEGASTSNQRVYNYHTDYDTFMPLNMRASCAVSGEDSSGYETVFIGDEDGYIYKYDIRQPYTDAGTVDAFTLDVSKLDEDKLEESTLNDIESNLWFSWYPQSDMETSYNFRDFLTDSVMDPNDADQTIDITAYVNYQRQTASQYNYDIVNTPEGSGFQLDVSRLDEVALADDRSRIRAKADLNIAGYNILIGLSKTVSGQKWTLERCQLNYTQNGNLN
jgi:hypothetical protein